MPTSDLSPAVLAFAREVQTALDAKKTEEPPARHISPMQIAQSQATMAIENRDVGAAARFVATMLSL